MIYSFFSFTTDHMEFYKTPMPMCQVIYGPKKDEGYCEVIFQPNLNTDWSIL